MCACVYVCVYARVSACVNMLCCVCVNVGLLYCKFHVIFYDSMYIQVNILYTGDKMSDI